MKRRQGQLWRCTHDDKTAYSSYRMAERVGNRLEEAPRIYWCPQAGGYHVTRLTAEEYDQRSASYLSGEMSA